MGSSALASTSTGCIRVGLEGGTLGQRSLYQGKHKYGIRSLGAARGVSGGAFPVDLSTSVAAV